MEILAIIPARGGSKGVLRKNVKLLDGKPLIAYVINQANYSHMITRVIVSTDDPEIGQVAVQYGAEVINRPADISGDEASSELALLHVLETLFKKENYYPELVTFLQCTSPLTLAKDIDGTIQSLLDENADSALAVTPFHYFLWEKKENGEAVGINHNKNIRLLRQSRSPQFLETGAVYVFRTEGFKRARHRFFGKTTMHVMPEDRCLEIDELFDFHIAEILIQEKQKADKRG